MSESFELKNLAFVTLEDALRNCIDTEQAKELLSTYLLLQSTNIDRVHHFILLNGHSIVDNAAQRDIRTFNDVLEENGMYISKIVPESVHIQDCALYSMLINRVNVCEDDDDEYVLN